PDGKWIAYDSTAVDLVTGQGTSTVQLDNVYVFNNDPNDAGYRTNYLASHIPGNQYSAGHNNSLIDTSIAIMTTRPAVSDDGRYVAFLSSADNLPSPTTSAGYNVFLFDRLAADPANNVTRITKSSIPSSSIPAYLGTLVPGTYPTNPLAPTI